MLYDLHISKIIPFNEYRALDSFHGIGITFSAIFLTDLHGVDN